MGWNIDLERVRETYAEFGQSTPFYEFQTSVPRPNLKELVKRGFLIRAGNKNKGYQWTATIDTLLEKAQQQEKRAAGLRDMVIDLGESRRGYALGSRKIPRFPDSDGNPRDTDNIDES